MAILGTVAVLPGNINIQAQPGKTSPMNDIKPPSQNSMFEKMLVCLGLSFSTNFTRVLKLRLAQINQELYYRFKN